MYHNIIQFVPFLLSSSQIIHYLFIDELMDDDLTEIPPYYLPRLPGTP
jgi:hypothetical protein